MKKMLTIKKINSIALVLLALCVSATDKANAQFKVRKDSLEKSTWYTAPRQIQIIDDSPIIHDYRQAPQTNQDNQYVNIPAGPSGGGNTIPEGGLHFGNQAPRVSSGGGLPRAGFGTNIPAGGIAHPGALPGLSRGGLLHPKGPVQASNNSAPRPSAPAPVVHSYNNYQTGGGSSYVSSNKSSSATVRGSLLRK